MTEFSLYLLTGALTGVCAGLLGIGGGFIVVPALLLILPAQGVEPEVTMHVALGTSLATICVTGVSSAWAHHRRGSIVWEQVKALAPGILVGAVIGGIIADYLPRAELTWIFGAFALLMALQMFTQWRPTPADWSPAAGTVAGTGVVFGMISAIVGIGGGSLVVPFMLLLNHPITRSVGSAAACNLPVAIAGSATYAVMGMDNPLLPDNSTGYIHWPAFLGIILASIFTAPLGARLAHWLPAGLLKRVFAAFLVLVGAKLLLG